MFEVRENSKCFLSVFVGYDKHYWYTITLDTLDDNACFDSELN